MWMRAMVLLSGMACAAMVSGCGGEASGGQGTTVVAGFYPYAYVAERVAGQHASVANLTSPGVDPHDLELTPQQVARVASADVVVYAQDFQPAVDDAVADNSTGATVEVSAAVAAHDSHTRGGLAADPHLWQDPTKLIPVAESLAGRLGEVDPHHAQAYHQNAASLAGDLRELDQDFRRGLGRCQRRTIVTSHAAFGHLAQRYRLQMVPIAGISPEVEPSPARLAELKHLVQARDITTIFSETLASPRLARTLAEEVGVRTAVLDPIEGLSGTGDADDYLSLMRSNLKALREANDCR